MFRSLLSCASIFVLLVSTFFSPASVSASRCGERMPVTLLSLYRSSQFIYIGTFDRVEEGEITGQTASYTIVPVKKFFSLSTSLKGETKKMLVLEDSEYRFKENQPEVVEAEEVAAESETETSEEISVAAPEADESETAETANGEDEVDEAELKPGDRVLLFLNKDEGEDNEGELELADYSDGLKKMTPERLAAYEPRIRELNAIFSKDEPSYPEIVAWLVRCAEDPETRWEGSYELERSFQYMDWKAQRAKLAEQKPPEQADQPDPERYLPRAPKKFDTGDENFAKELTEGQKLLLTNAMLDRERPKPAQGSSGEGTTGLNRGDRELIELVRRWGDSKVAINILEQLRYDSSDPNLNGVLMSSVASILNNEELSSLAEQYSDIDWRNEEDEVEAEDDEGKPAAVENDQASTETESNTVETVDVPDEEFADTPDESGSDARSVPPKNEPKKKTYGEVRAELLKKFLDRADRLIAKMEKGK